MSIMIKLDNDLRKYVENEIIPRYDSFDGAHGREHVGHVIRESLNLAGHYDVDPNMVYVIAAYHDTGLVAGRKNHHIESGKILRNDSRLPDWFSGEQIETMACAAEDHRASNENEPRSIYGKIVAEADRQIDGLTIIRRTIQFGLSNCPELDKEGHWNRMMEHIRNKYAEGGYLKLWIPESSNALKLAEFRELLRDGDRMREIFEKIYGELVTPHNKEEYPPMHTAEHILNATMVRMFGCPRSRNAHIEKKKSKCDYLLEQAPTDDQVAEIEKNVNEAIGRNLDVRIRFISRKEAESIVDLSKLPAEASDTLRIVEIGDCDICACIGKHVRNTSEIGTFRIVSHSYENGVWRVRWKVQ